MTRLPVVAFAALVVATVAAFFLTQHLKVSTPLLAGFPRPVPPGINPVGGIRCLDPVTGKQANYRVMTLSFYLLNHSDDVDVWVTDGSGRRVATLARGRYMSGGSHPVRTQFVWNGRTQDGAVAPDGAYYVKVRLIHLQRTVTISNSAGPISFRVMTVPPKPVVTLVQPRVFHASRPVPVRIGYRGNENRLATVLIYHLGGRRPRVVKSFLSQGHSAVWDGLIRKQPPAPGTYLVGLEVTDLACNTGYFPPTVSPLPAGAGATEVTVLP